MSSPPGPSRLLVAIAVWALCTAGAGAAAATLLTGSANPPAWIATYQIRAECHQAAAAQDPRCSVAAAQAAAELRLADSLESKAKALAAQAANAPGPNAIQQAQSPTQPAQAQAAAPPAPPAAPSHDDYGTDD